MSALISQVILFSLALWVGGSVLVVLAAPVLFRMVPSRDQAGGAFGEILRRFEAVKQLLSLLLVIGVFVELERAGGLAGRAVVSGIAIFVAVATNVYLSMVLRPRMNYFRMKVGSFDAAGPDDPWRRKFDGLHRRSSRIFTLGALAAGIALWFRGS
ncbi:MAG: DUF4149 domain-containing protein [Acidobacteriota bacterium]|nr:DUF4149 domain-containing protein [Acidobacteriota bacterium]